MNMKPLCSASKGFYLSFRIYQSANSNMIQLIQFQLALCFLALTNTELKIME